MKTTFKNLGNDPEAFKKAAKNYLQSRVKDFKAFMEAEDLESVLLDGNMQSFYDYGLSIDYVIDNDRKPAYLRYQLSWGGPSDEIRFYYNPGKYSRPYRIEYVYLDWFTGIGYDVTGESWAQWLSEYFDGIGIVESEINKALQLV